MLPTLPAQQAQFNELAAVTRRAFMGFCVLQIYNNSPLMASGLANAQSAGGGVSSVTVPVQGAPLVQAGVAGYDGNFQPPPALTALQNAEFNLKLYVCPVPFLGTEGLVQIDFAIIPIVEARMNDMTNATMHLMATDAYASITDPLHVVGLNGAIDDGTNVVTYGNISRTANTWWQSYVRAAGGVPPTRKELLAWIVGLNASCGEHPSFAVTDAGTWAALAQDYVGAESYVITPGNAFDTDGDRPRAAFKALDCAGVPIFFDPYVPTASNGTIWLVNSNYLNFYWHDNAAFNFSGWHSTIPNYTLGYIGLLINAWEIVNVKPKCSGRITGFQGVTGL
jgi:hypothetical protein